MGRRFLHLVRHGAYHLPAEHPQHGSLTSLGCRQMRRAAAALASVDAAALWSSTLPRAIQSADLVAARLPEVPRRRWSVLCETMPGMPADLLELAPVNGGMSLPRLFARMACERGFRSRIIGRVDLPHLRRHCLAQAEHAWRLLTRPVQRDQHLVVVCHGNLIRYFWARACGLEPFLWSRFAIHHASITRIEVRSRRQQVPVSFNETGHLPPGLRTC